MCGVVAYAAAQTVSKRTRRKVAFWRVENALTPVGSAVAVPAGPLTGCARQWESGGQPRSASGRFGLRKHDEKRMHTSHLAELPRKF